MSQSELAEGLVRGHVFFPDSKRLSLGNFLAFICQFPVLFTLAESQRIWPGF